MDVASVLLDQAGISLGNSSRFLQKREFWAKLSRRFSFGGL